MDSLGVTPYKNVWMQSFLLLLSSLSSCVAVLSNIMFSGVCNWYQSLQSLLVFLSFFLLH
jgi:hypothetical protein